MNALTVVQPQSHAIAAPAFTMDEMERVALAIAKGRLFGSDDPNAVLTLCMLAQAEGKHPALIMQNYHIIKGKPAKKAEAMLVDFLAAGGKVEWHALTDDIADATFSHPAGGSVRISWDNERVAKAGLTSNDNHKKFSRQMKRARVISEGVRTVFPGATSGLYVPEEVQEFEDRPLRAAAPMTSAPKPTAAPQRVHQITSQPSDAKSPGATADPAPSPGADPSPQDAGSEAASTDRDKHYAWLNDRWADINQAESLDDLDVIARKAAKGLARMREAGSEDLAEKFDDALAKRRAELVGVSDPDVPY